MLDVGLVLWHGVDLGIVFSCVLMLLMEFDMVVVVDSDVGEIAPCLCARIC